MSSSDNLEAQLTEIAHQIQVTAPWDISPRGIRFRPDEVLARQLQEVARQGDAVVPGLAKRLLAMTDPFQALVWLYLLTQIGTPDAQRAIDTFVARMKREKLWVGQFPGQREVLLFMGCSDESGEVSA